MIEYDVSESKALRKIAYTLQKIKFVQQRDSDAYTDTRAHAHTCKSDRATFTWYTSNKC